MDVAYTSSNNIERVTVGFAAMVSMRAAMIFPPPHPVKRSVSTHERHHIEKLPVRFTTIEQREQVRALQPRHHPDLGEEPLFAYNGGELRIEDLERHVTVVPLPVLRGRAQGSAMPV